MKLIEYNETKIDDNKKYELDELIDKFIKWYYITFDKYTFKDVGEHNSIDKIKNFIEKMAVWYELRYPSYEVNKVLPFEKKEEIDIDNEMFINNPYVINYIKNRNTNIEYNELEGFSWSDFYNIDTFINTLPKDERDFLKKPTYNTFIYIDSSDINAHLHLYDNGIINEAEYIGIYTHYKIKDYELKDMDIKSALELFKEREIKLLKIMV